MVPSNDGTLSRVGETTFPRTQRTWATAHGDPFDVGQDSGSPVSPSYASPFSFTGRIEKVVVDVGPAGAASAPPPRPD